MLALGSALLGRRASPGSAACLRVGAPLQAWLGPYTVTGFAVGMIGAIPLMMVRAFPAAIRFTGISFSYNIAYATFWRPHADSDFVSRASLPVMSARSSTSRPMRGGDRRGSVAARYYASGSLGLSTRSHPCTR